MGKQMVRCCCRQFSARRQNVHDEGRSERPTIITDDLVEQRTICLLMTLDDGKMVLFGEMRSGIRHSITSHSPYSRGKPRRKKSKPVNQPIQSNHQLRMDDFTSAFETTVSSSPVQWWKTSCFDDTSSNDYDDDDNEEGKRRKKRKNIDNDFIIKFIVLMEHHEGEFRFIRSIRGFRVIAKVTPHPMKKKKVEDSHRRITRITERYPDYKDDVDVLTYLRAIGHSLASNFET
ncbi:hypothetical protein ANN_13976 [Periplaneta americana]|uniref:Uncharacterized protein n=1 Tax=Periplaneta americana TaxID=6978 RepID=A0ABQ8SWI2_PERAM|nr:hypothetical protein ANN_13976 [Periplaneta americana]